MHEALSDLYSLTTDRQQSDSLPATFAQRDDFPGIPDNVWDDVVKYLYDHGGYTPEMLSADEVLSLISATHSTLMKSVSKGLSHEVSPELTSALEENTFIFSGFKTHAELKEASLLLRGDDGGLKSFEQFKRDVQSINETYNVQYLRSEYSYAEASAHVAMKWKDWEKGGRNYMLQYRTANDDRVRDSHRLLHNTTLPMSDPFWNSYLPPNGWNCRCTAVQVRKGKYEVSNSAEAIAKGEAATALPKQKIFRFNPGKQMKVFPDKHPYFPKGCGNCGKTLLSYDPNSEQCRACKAIAKCLNKFGNKETVKQRRNEIREKISHFVGKEFVHPTFEHKTTLTGGSLKELLNQPHKHYNEKNEAILHIDAIYESSTYLGKLSRKPNANFDSFLFRTKIADENSWIVVKKMDNETMYKIYSISDQSKLEEFIE